MKTQQAYPSKMKIEIAIAAALKATHGDHPEFQLQPKAFCSIARRAAGELAAEVLRNPGDDNFSKGMIIKELRDLKETNRKLRQEKNNLVKIMKAKNLLNNKGNT